MFINSMKKGGHNLEEYNIRQLHKIARKRKVPKYSTYNKLGLLRLLSEGGEYYTVSSHAMGDDMIKQTACELREIARQQNLPYYCQFKKPQLARILGIDFVAGPVNNADDFPSDENEEYRAALQTDTEKELLEQKSAKEAAMEEQELDSPQESTSDKLQVAQHLVDQLKKLREEFVAIPADIPEITTPGWKKYQLDVKKKNTRLKQGLDETRRSILSLGGKVSEEEEEEEEETRKLAVENQVLEKVLLEKSIIRLDLLKKHLLN